jgi:hypothetical protein
MMKRVCLLALLLAAPACHRSPSKNVEGRSGPIGMRSPLDRPRLGWIPGPKPGGGSGGIFNAAGREAEGGTEEMKLGHPPPTDAHWSLRGGNATGRANPKHHSLDDDINVQDMNRSRLQHPGLPQQK